LANEAISMGIPPAQLAAEALRFSYDDV